MPDDLCPICGAYWQCGGHGVDEDTAPIPERVRQLLGLDIALGGGHSAIVFGHIEAGVATVDHSFVFMPSAVLLEDAMMTLDAETQALDHPWILGAYGPGH